MPLSGSSSVPSQARVEGLEWRMPAPLVRPGQPCADFRRGLLEATHPRLDIVIVNRNSGNLLRETVGSIPSAVTLTFQLDRVIVVDNASRDGSVGNLAVVNIALSVLHNDEDKGFAASCNQGTAGSDADYLLFLKPGTVLNATSIGPCINFLEAERNRMVGIAAPQLRDHDGAVVRGSKRAPTGGTMLAQGLGLDRLLPGLFKPRSMLEWDHLATRSVQQVAEPFLLIRRDLFDRLGGFDERFVGHFEHDDLCLRARKAGYKIVHFASGSARSSAEPPSEPLERSRLLRFWQSRLHYAEQHFGPVGRAAARAVTFLLEPAALAMRALVRGPGGEANEVWSAAKLIWRHASSEVAFFSKRRGF
jgi:GT2 family glycosyltransferase